VARLEQYVKAIDEDIDGEARRNETERDKLERRLTKAHSQLREDVVELKTNVHRVTTAIGGDDGHSLRRTFVGLAITAIGVACTLFEPIDNNVDLF